LIILQRSTGILPAAIFPRLAISAYNQDFKIFNACLKCLQQVPLGVKLRFNHSLLLKAFQAAESK